MEEKEIKQQLAVTLAECIKMKAELEAFKELFYELIDPGKRQEIKEEEAKTIIKFEKIAKDNYPIHDPELKIMFLREFHPYKQ